MKSKAETKLKIASIMLGILSIVLLFLLGFFVLLLLAFAPTEAWIPLMPSGFFAVLGLLAGVYGKTKTGIIINTIILIVIIAFIGFLFHIVAFYVPQPAA